MPLTLHTNYTFGSYLADKPGAPGSVLDLALHALARLAFSARIGRALFHRARSASKKDSLAAAFPFFRAHLLLSSQGSLVDPRVRASNEHIPIVRVPRAGGRPGCPSSSLGREWAWPIHSAILHA